MTLSKAHTLVIPAGCPAQVGRRAGTQPDAAQWVPDLRPAQGRAFVRDDNEEREKTS